MLSNAENSIEKDPGGFPLFFCQPWIVFDFGSYPLAALQMTDLPSLFCVLFLKATSFFHSSSTWNDGLLVSVLLSNASLEFYGHILL